MAIKKPEETKVKTIKPGSPEMERFISIGYQDIATREHAQEILKGRKENPALVPYELAERAKAFLAAIDAKVEVIDVDNPGVRNTRPR